MHRTQSKVRERTRMDDNDGGRKMMTTTTNQQTGNGNVATATEQNNNVCGHVLSSISLCLPQRDCVEYCVYLTQKYVKKRSHLIKWSDLWFRNVYMSVARRLIYEMRYNMKY